MANESLGRGRDAPTLAPQIAVLGVPFDGFGRIHHQADAASVLRSAGLLSGVDSVHRVVDSGDISLPSPDPRRGPRTALINEPALEAMAGELDERVAQAVGSGQFPLVVGGDCASLLGIVPGFRRADRAARLVFVDGHEDTMPLDVTEDGEAANCEIGLLLGITGRTISGPLSAKLPALERGDLAMLGQRDEPWRRQFNVGSLRDGNVWMRDAAEVVTDPGAAGRAAVAHVGTSWWLHVDLDVLDPHDFAAQGLPDVDDEPGGLSWAALTTLLVSMVAVGGCIGWSLVIYDPDQDPSRSDARRIIDLVRVVLAEVP